MLSNEPDSHYWLSGGYETDFATYLCDTFDELYDESRDMPRMMSVGLHMRMVGRPGRMRALRRFLDHATSKGDVWFATRLQIARAFREAMERPDRRS